MDDSECCFLKAKCTHSMKISDTPHSAWICANKNNGFIVNAYCTCVAGMSSSCIHITALLFRVEANFYRVFTKVESMKVNEENSADKLVDSLLGKAKPPTNLPPLKYGRDMGPLQLRNSSNTSKNTTRMLGIENVVSLLIKLNSTWEHPQTY
ncbi:hypothetical protein ABFA07_008461 [Porites harrisoni]